MYKLIILFFIPLNLVFAQNNKNFVTKTNPENTIVNSLINNKILMLGELPHHNPFLYNSLINILNLWLEKAKKSDNNKKLILILEMDSIFARLIDNYIKNGIIWPIQKFVAPEWSYEDLEFWINLRKFQIKLDSINFLLKKNIYFEVKGFEVSSFNYLYYVDTTFLKKNQSENELWYIKERDKNLSKGIINYKERNIDDEILIYYGTAHLYNGLTYKNYDFTHLTEDQSKGYFLAYYLKNKFGENNVLTVYQFFSNNELIPDFFKNYKSISLNKSILFIPKLKSDMINNDYYIFYPNKINLSQFPHPFSFVFSNVILDHLKSTVCTIEKNFPSFNKYSISYTYDIQFFFSYIITGRSFSNCFEIGQYINETNNFNKFIRIDSYNFEKEIYGLDSLVNNTPSNKILLCQLGFNDEDFIENKLDTLVWHNKVWLNVYPKIKYVNAIGIYWIGDPDEKEIAKKYLIKFSGQDYDEPEKYLQWYRKNILGEDY